MKKKNNRCGSGSSGSKKKSKRDTKESTKLIIPRFSFHRLVKEVLWMFNVSVCSFSIYLCNMTIFVNGSN
jgi:hypothetical protein